jgi:hypothetical protein
MRINRIFQLNWRMKENCFFTKPPPACGMRDGLIITEDDRRPPTADSRRLSASREEFCGIRDRKQLAQMEPGSPAVETAATITYRFTNGIQTCLKSRPIFDEAQTLGKRRQMAVCGLPSAVRGQIFP